MIQWIRSKLDNPLKQLELESRDRLRFASRVREIRSIPSGLLPPEGKDPGENLSDQVGSPDEESGGHDAT